MSFFQNFLLIVAILIALGVIALVLLQHGKGADTGASFGSGSSGSLFGATGSSNFLSRTTAVLITLFFIVSLWLSYLTSQNKNADASSSVVQRLQSNPSLLPTQSLTQPAPNLPSVPQSIAPLPSVVPTQPSR